MALGSLVWCCDFLAAPIFLRLFDLACFSLLLLLLLFPSSSLTRRSSVGRCVAVIIIEGSLLVLSIADGREGDIVGLTGVGVATVFVVGVNVIGELVGLVVVGSLSGVGIATGLVAGVNTSIMVGFAVGSLLSGVVASGVGVTLAAAGPLLPPPVVGSVVVFTGADLGFRNVSYIINMRSVWPGVKRP
jgi:hypothetical protein